MTIQAAPVRGSLLIPIPSGKGQGAVRKAIAEIPQTIIPENMRAEVQGGDRGRFVLVRGMAKTLGTVASELAQQGISVLFTKRDLAPAAVPGFLTRSAGHVLQYQG